MRSATPDRFPNMSHRLLRTWGAILFTARCISRPTYTSLPGEVGPGWRLGGRVRGLFPSWIGIELLDIWHMLPYIVAQCNSRDYLGGKSIDKNSIYVNTTIFLSI